MKRICFVLGMVLLIVCVTSAVLGCGGEEATTETTAAPDSSTDTSTEATTAATVHQAPEGARVLTFCSMGGPQGMNLRANQAFIHWIEVASGGTLTIEYSYGTIPAGEELAAVRDGLFDMGQCNSGFLTGLVTANDVTTLPWLGGWPGALQATLAHMDLYKQFAEMQAEAEGVKLLWVDHAGPTQIQTTGKPIQTAADLKGLNQIEIGPIPAETMKLLGTTPLSFPPVENFDALSKGVADGVSVNWDACQTFGYFDVIKYCTQASVTNPSFFFEMMNLDTYESLTDEQKALFSEENCLKMAKAFGFAFDHYDQEGREIMAQKFVSAGLPEIYVLPDDERNKWKEATQSITDNWISTVTAAGLPGQAIYDATVEAFSKYAWTEAMAAEALAIIEEWENAQ